MKFFYSILFFFFTFSKVFCQSDVQLNAFLDKWRSQLTIQTAGKIIISCDSLLKYKCTTIDKSNILSLKASAFRQKNKPNEALTFHLKVLALREKILGVFAEPTIKSYRNVANVYSDLGKNVVAKEYYKKALTLTKSLCGDDAEELIQPLLGLSRVSEAKNRLIFLQKAYELQERYEDNIEEKNASCIIIINLYLDKNDIDSADVLLKKMEKSFSKFSEKLKGRYFLAKATLENMRNDYSSAHEFSEKAKAYFNFEEEDLADILNLQGTISRWQNDSKSALTFFDAAIEIYTKNQNRLKIGTVYQNKANVYKDLRLYSTAISYYQKAEPYLSEKNRINCVLDKIDCEFKMQRFNKKQLQTLNCYAENKDENIFYTSNYLIAKYFFQEKKYQEAQKYYEKNIKVLDFEGSKNLYQYLQIQLGLADIAAATNNSEAVLYHCEEAQKRLALKEANLNEHDLILLEQEMYRIYELAIQANFSQKQFEKAFYWSELAKNNLTKRLANNNKWKDFVGNIELIKQQIASDETLVSYHVGKNELYIFIFNQNTFDTKIVPLNSNTIKNVQILYHWCSTPSKELSEADDQKYALAAFALQQQFIAPVQKSLKNKLVIVPDSYLAYVPFETLLETAITDTKSIRNYPFLLKKYTIRYSNSASLLAYFKSIPAAENNAKLLAFAPTFAKESGFEPLLHNEEEINKIEPFFDAQLAKNEKATAANFISQSADYQLLHLATHGKIVEENSRTSFIVFSKDSINQKEHLDVTSIEKLTLHADILVLSACVSAMGRVYRGEGVLSIARAFQATGVRTVVASLWNVNDSTTPELMQSFYQNLSNKMTKSIALSEAKRTYVSNASSHNLAHPYYWAGFIMVGDDAPLLRKQNYFIWIAGFFCVLLAFYFSKINISTHKPQ